MFDFSTLITDRAAADLENLRALLSTPMEDWTAEQLAQFNQAISKGAYNYTDLNRVTACMEYLDETLRSYGYETGYQKIEVPHKAESGGLPAVTEYRYLRMTITAIRVSGSTVQLSEIKLEDSDNGLDFTWPVTTTVTSSIQAVSNEPAQNLIDGSTSTKFCSTAFSSGATLTIDLGEGNHVDLGLYNTWQWYTANDKPERDPISFSLDVSNDGTHWLSVDSVSDASITETRQALAYSGSITLPTFTRVAYIESSGTEYIDTGVNPTQSTRIVLSIQTQQVGSTLCGADVGWIPNNGLALGPTFAHYGTQSCSNIQGINDGQPHVVELGVAKLLLDTVTMYSFAEQTFSVNYPIALCANNRAGSIEEFVAMAIMSAKIYNGENLMRDFLPCMNSSGAVGLYDLISDQFYGNSGSGAFVAGPEVPPPEPEPTLDPYTWYETDVPTQSEMAQYLSNVLSVVSVFIENPQLPQQMTGLTVDGANQIESALLELWQLIEILPLSFVPCGEALCGGDNL